MDTWKLNAPANLKHRCLLQLLYAGGLRIGEVINLKLTDVQSGRNLLLIRGGKGKKTAPRCYRKNYWKACGPTLNNTGQKTGCLKVSLAANIRLKVSGTFSGPVKKKPV